MALCLIEGMINRELTRKSLAVTKGKNEFEMIKLISIKVVGHSEIKQYSGNK